MSETNKEWEPVTMSLPESYELDCKHLRQLLNSSSFEGTTEQRLSLIGRLKDLEREFSSVSLEELRENYENRKNIFPEWNRKYSMIKLAVYKACGYTRTYDSLNKVFG